MANSIHENHTIWITLFGAMSELPINDLAQGLAIGTMAAARLKVHAQEYVMEDHRRMALAVERGQKLLDEQSAKDRTDDQR